MQRHIASRCNCTNIAIISTSFECTSSSQAVYSFVILGEGALAAAVALNHSLNNEGPFTTEIGIKFTLYEPDIVNSTTTSVPNSNDDIDTMMVHLNVLIVLTVILLILGLITAFTVGW